MINTQTRTKTKIKPCFKHYGKTQAEQIKINQQGLEMLKKWELEDSQLTESEIKHSQETWEMVKAIVDENRSRNFLDNHYLRSREWKVSDNPDT